MKKNAAYYKTMFSIKDAELDLFREKGRLINDSMNIIYEHFYDWMETDPIFAQFFSDEVIDGIKANEEQLWADIVDFPLDEEYIERQQFFGQTFAASGLPHEAYFASIVAFHQFIYNVFEERELLTIDLVGAFKKVSGISMAIILDIYQETTQKILMEQNQALMAMSTPVTQLWDGILLLPLVGFIDSKRAQDVMTAMLNMITDTQSKVFILDISGVAVVDTAVANYLIKITKATRLMGCTCLISGISGSVAQTIVELGIQIEEVSTTGTMKEALNQALGATGAQVVYLGEK